jgi:hypothetical protein
VEPGDVLLHGAFDCHANRSVSEHRERILRLPWPHNLPEGRFRVRNPEALTKAAECDPDAATELLRAALIEPPPAALHWTAPLAADLGVNSAIRLEVWSEMHGLSPETVSRGFHRAFDVAPKVDVHFNLPVDDNLFVMDAGTAKRSAESHGWNRALPVEAPTELAPGVDLYLGAWNSTIIKQPDGVAILEAPISETYFKGVIEEAQRRYPGQPIKAVLYVRFLATYWWCSSRHCAALACLHPRSKSGSLGAHDRCPARVRTG